MIALTFPGYQMAFPVSLPISIHRSNGTGQLLCYAIIVRISLECLLVAVRVQLPSRI